MENAIELIHKGQPGLITLLGMGGVFLALIILFIFTSFLGKLSSIDQSRKQAGKARSAQQPVQAQPVVQAEPSANEELAAAVAVACALGLAGEQKISALPPAQKFRDDNPWRVAGRLALMKSWKPANKTERWHETRAR